uniref:TBC domain-containing protein n=1 Tax=Panagrellus redivivus TaxID=6233 RepID=A0A7E4W3R4_PANRE
MRFPDCPPTLREGVLGLTLFQIFNDHNRKKDSDFISREAVETAFKQFTGQDAKDVFESMSMTIFDFVDQFFADFVDSIAFDRRPGFKVQRTLSRKVYKKFWDIGPVEDASSKMFGLDAIPMASVASTDIAVSGKIFSLDDLTSLGASITTLTGSSSTSSSESSSPPPEVETETPVKPEPTSSKSKPAAAKPEPAPKKEPLDVKKEPATKEPKSEAKNYFGLESLVGVSSAASSSNVSDATSSKSVTREPTPEQPPKAEKSKESAPVSQASTPKAPSKSQSPPKSSTSVSSVNDNSASTSSKKAAKATVAAEALPKAVPPPPKPQAKVTPVKPRPNILSHSELMALVDTSYVNVITQEQMTQLGEQELFNNIVPATRTDSAQTLRAPSPSPQSGPSESTPYTRFVLSRDNIVTNFDVAVASRQQILDAVQRFPLNVAICRWVEGFLHFADIVLCLQYMNHFFKLYKEPVSTACYHLFVKAVADREPIFLDVVPLVGCLDIMLAWDFLRLKPGRDDEPDIITLNPLVTKLTMTPLGVGMPSVLFFALTEQFSRLAISDLCASIDVPQPQAIELLLDTINKRPDLYILSAPSRRGTEPVMFIDCFVQLNPRVVPLSALYNYKLNDLSFFEELKLRKDDVDSVSQFE